MDDQRALKEDDRRKRSDGPDTQDRNSQDTDKDGGQKTTRRWPLYTLGVAILIAAIAGSGWWWLTRNDVSTDDAYTDGRAVMIAPHVSGYVTVLAVSDNQFVHRGDMLIQIDPRDYTAARNQAQGTLVVAQAQLDAALAGLEKARVDFPSQKISADAAVQSVEAQLQRAQADNRRQQAVTAAATTQQQRDTTSAELRQAEAQLKQALAQAAQAAQVEQNIRQADAQVAQLQGQVEQARAQLDQAELNLSWTRVVAPSDGWVTRRNVERGNLVQTGSPILSLVEPITWITANFKEGQLDRMKPGQPVDISVDAYPGLKLKGHVDSVQMGSGARFTAFPAENATGNFVKIVRRVPVKIDIDSGLTDGPLPLGISVVPTVHVK